MAPRSSSSSSSSPSKSPPLPPLHPSPLFTPIQECKEEEEEHGHHDEREIARNPMSMTTPQRHNPTPLHHRSSHNRVSSSVPLKKTYALDTEEGGGGTLVSCSDCRPHACDKISIVPLDNINCRRSSAVPSPNGILKSIVSMLTGKSPRSDDGLPSSFASVVIGEDRWQAAVAELSHKLVEVTQRRDEASTEASRLKSSVSELEKKMDSLESYCRNIKTDLDQCSAGARPTRRTPSSIPPTWFTFGNSNDKVIERFLVTVADTRSAVRILSRSLTVQLQSSRAGGKVYEILLLLLKPYEVRVSLMRNPRGLVCYLEALLNRAFFEDFEAIGYQKSGTTLVLNPMERCAGNLEQFRILDGLTWEEVLSKGTRHFSEEFSRFCDRKMSEIVGTLGWNRAWPEPLLRAFFRASKSTWLVHLLANSVHPALPLFRVEARVPFDPVYMEDMSADRVRRLVPSTVRAMVAPGFYVYGSVVKCKVLCRYHTSHSKNTSNNINNGTVADEEIKTALAP